MLICPVCYPTTVQDIRSHNRSRKVLDLLWGTAWCVGGTARLSFGYCPAPAGWTVGVSPPCARRPLHWRHRRRLETPDDEPEAEYELPETTGDREHEADVHPEDFGDSA